MIKYALGCDNGHSFEIWFRNSGDFEEQRRAGYVNCPHCGSTEVEKRLMAPNVSTSRKQENARNELERKAVVSAVEKQHSTQKASAGKGTAAQENASVSAAAAPMLGGDAITQEAVESLRKLRDHVTKNAEYVGADFADEARKIHYGEAEQRGIYGESSLDDVRELVDEGIDLLPLPSLPEDKN